MEHGLYVIGRLGTWKFDLELGLYVVVQQGVITFFFFKNKSCPHVSNVCMEVLLGNCFAEKLEFAYLWDRFWFSSILTWNTLTVTYRDCLEPQFHLALVQCQ